MPTLPRIPGVRDPLRRIRVPADLEAITSIGAEDDPDTGGMHRKQIERIWEQAVSVYRSGVYPAIQVCVRRNGAVLLDRAIGHASGNGPDDSPDTERVPITTNTPILTYSASKGVTALLVHKLIERGAIELDAPVAQYIPEYARNGKQTITVGHVLSHRAGVAILPRGAFSLDRVGDREFALQVMCDAKPLGQPGQFQAYHAVSGGYILGEIVHRVTGNDIRSVLAKEILDPLGFRWTNYGVAEADLPQVAVDAVTGPPLLPPFSTLITRSLSAPLAEVVDIANDARFRTAIVPAANVVSTAAELSRFYDIFCNGGTLDGVEIVEPNTIRRALTEQTKFEVDLSLGVPMRFGYGLVMGGKRVSLFGPETRQAFGHPGLSYILAWADPERALSCAILTTGKPTAYPEAGRFFRLVFGITARARKVHATKE